MSKSIFLTLILAGCVVFNPPAYCSKTERKEARNTYVQARTQEITQRAVLLEILEKSLNYSALPDPTSPDPARHQAYTSINAAMRTYADSVIGRRKAQEEVNTTHEGSFNLRKFWLGTDGVKRKRIISLNKQAQENATEQLIDEGQMGPRLANLSSAMAGQTLRNLFIIHKDTLLRLPSFDSNNAQNQQALEGSQRSLNQVNQQLAEVSTTIEALNNEENKVNREVGVLIAKYSRQNRDITHEDIDQFHARLARINREKTEKKALQQKLLQELDSLAPRHSALEKQAETLLYKNSVPLYLRELRDILLRNPSVAGEAVSLDDPELLCDRLEPRSSSPTSSAAADAQAPNSSQPAAAASAQ